MEALAHFLKDLVHDLGYPGLFLLIVLESTAVPVPSLLVMPFAGYLASKGFFTLPAILAINGAGALVGSGLSYWFGAAGGKPLLLKYGKYILVRPEDIERTHAYFERFGARTIFIARFIPVIRHIISIPAGIARMNLAPFFGLTFAGAMAWGGGLMVLGYELGDNWEHVVRTWKKIDVVVAGLVVLGIVIVAARFIRGRRARAAAAAGGADRAGTSSNRESGS